MKVVVAVITIVSLLLVHRFDKTGRKNAMTLAVASAALGAGTLAVMYYLAGSWFGVTTLGFAALILTALLMQRLRRHRNTAEPEEAPAMNDH